MSSSETSSKSSTSILWVLGSFIGFAVLFYLVQALFGTEPVTDPRSPDRLVIKEEVLAEQNALLAKMGLDQEAKRSALFSKAAAELKNRKAAKSAFVVPGSPTQLKQMAAEAPPPAPAPAPSAGAAPATVPAASNPATPVPASAPSAPAPAVTPVPPAPAPAPAPSTSVPGTTAPVAPTVPPAPAPAKP